MIYGVFLTQKKNKILIIGASGTLGKAIKKNNFFKNALTPNKKKLNITYKEEIKKYLKKKNFQIIINCAAISKVKQCEDNPKIAKEVNILGVKKLVKCIKDSEKKNKSKALLIHLSSDAVYPPHRGNNKENSSLAPYNFYGKTKLESEKIVKKLNNYIIIRTRFFDKNNIKFKDAATDIFSSMIEKKELVKNIIFLINSGYKGVINIGGPKISDYNAIKKYKKKILKTTSKKILKNLKHVIATDASLNVSLFKKLKRNYEKKRF